MRIWFNQLLFLLYKILTSGEINLNENGIEWKVSQIDLVLKLNKKKAQVLEIYIYIYTIVYSIYVRLSSKFEEAKVLNALILYVFYYSVVLSFSKLCIFLYVDIALNVANSLVLHFHYSPKIEHQHNISINEIWGMDSVFWLSWRRVATRRRTSWTGESQRIPTKMLASEQLCQRR